MHLPDRYAIIPVFPSTNTDEAIVIGDMRQVMEYIPQSAARADAMAELDRRMLTADEICHAQERTRAVQVAAFCDSVTQLSKRLDSYELERLERIMREQEEAERQEQARLEDRSRLC
jgi:hypothetical protein